MRQYVTLHPCYANNSHSSVPKGGGGGLTRASLNTKSSGWGGGGQSRIKHVIFVEEIVLYLYTKEFESRTQNLKTKLEVVLLFDYTSMHSLIIII